MRGSLNTQWVIFGVTDQEGGASHGGTKAILHFPGNFAEKTGF